MTNAPRTPLPQLAPEPPKKKKFWHKVTSALGAVVETVVSIALGDSFGGRE